MATPVAVDPVDGAAAEADFLSMALLLATLAATVTYSAGLSPPGGFWPDGGLLARDPVLRYRAFFYFNATAFVASLVAVVVLLLQRNQRIRRRTLLAAMTLDFVCLIGTFAGGYGRTQISTYVVALVAAVLSLAVIKLLVFLYYLVKNLIHEALQRHLQQFGRLEHRIHEEHQSRASERADDDAYKILRKSHKYLLLLGILSASITYQAGLSPPGGFWQDNAAAADGRTHNFAGDPVLHITYHRRYLVFFYCNATAFVASLVIVLLLLSNIFSTQSQRIKYCALQATMILDLFGLMGAYAAGSCRQLVYVSVLVVSAFLYVGFHVLMIKVFPASSEAPREKMAPCVPGLSKPAYQVHAEGDEAMERKLEKTRKLLLLLAILAASLTYQAGMSPPGGLWQENNSGHVVGDPVVNDNSRRRYKAFFYCKAMSFVASLVITVLLVNKRLSAGGIRSHALQVCLIIGLMGAYGAGAGTYRKISMVDVLLLFLAVIVCISLQIASLVSGSARGPVQRLVPKLGWPQVLGLEDDCGSSSLSTPRDQLVSPLFHGACKVIDSLRSGTWMLVFFLVIRQPALRQNLKVKFKVSKISAVLGVLLVSASPMTAATTMDTPSTATPSSTGMVRRRRDPPLVKAEDEPTRPRRNRRPNSQLIGGDWVNS